jgi:hypothetical protein
MENNLATPDFTPEPDAQRRKSGVAAILTVALGAAFAIWVIFRFRPPEAPPPVVVESPPQIRVERPPAPPPQVIYKEAPRFEPPPPPVTALPPSGWAGVWRKGKDALPIFQLKDAGWSIVGTCVPNWGTHFPIRYAKPLGDDLEFVVEDGIIRTHFLMHKAGENQATVENWITEDDWVESFKRANMVARTPQSALLYRQILQKNAELRGNRVTAGTFTRNPAASEESDSPWATPPPGVRRGAAPRWGAFGRPSPRSSP